MIGISAFEILIFLIFVTISDQLPLSSILDFIGFFGNVVGTRHLIPGVLTEGAEATSLFIVYESHQIAVFIPADNGDVKAELHLGSIIKVKQASQNRSGILRIREVVAFCSV